MLTSELLQVIRDETQYIVLVMRTMVEEDRKEFNTKKESRAAVEKVKEIFKDGNSFFAALKADKEEPKDA